MPTCPKCKHTWTDTPTPTLKPFPYKVRWENDSEQGNGSACVIFMTFKDSDIAAVNVNNEQARKGRPHLGHPVFLMKNPGHNYMRPLKMVIEMADGQKYSYVAGATASNVPDAPDAPDSSSGYKHLETYTSYGVRNGRQAWRISKRGDSLGPGPVKFTFSSGKTFTVKSTAKNCRDQESTCSRNSKAPMYGFVFKPGNGKPNGEGDNDIGTAHGGIYLHAPHGDNSKTVKMEW